MKNVKKKIWVCIIIACIYVVAMSIPTTVDISANLIVDTDVLIALSIKSP